MSDLKKGQTLTLDQRRFISIRSLYPLTDIFWLKHVKYRVNLEISKDFSVKLKIFYCSLFLYLLWMLKEPSH